MARRKKKFPLLLAVIIVLVAALLYPYLGDLEAGGGEDRVVESVEDGSLELHVIDVGQADALLLRTEQGDVLIDSGDLDTKDELKKYLDDCGVTELQYAIFTHPHADHIGAADVVITSYKVNNVVLPSVAGSDTPTTKVYERMIAAIEADSDINVVLARPDDVYEVGDLKMTVLAPNSKDYTDLNNYSVVVRADYGATSFMLTGDCEDVSEEEMLARYSASQLKCNFYKAAHHGARESNTEAFLKAVSPEIIAISCGEGNSYGHPHEEAMERFAATGAEIYRTDLRGTLIFVSDGNEIKLSK